MSIPDSFILTNNNRNPLFHKTDKQIVKTTTGMNHILCLLNNGELYCNGLNSYGQYGKAPLKLNNPHLSNFLKVNEIENTILQNCQIINVFTRYNFTIYLAINNITKKQMLLASGWNLAGCCSCNIQPGAHVQTISQCYFKQSEKDEMTSDLKDEEITIIGCAGCHLHIVTENIFTKEQFVYECGSNAEKVLNFERKDTPILTKTLAVTQLIKEIDKNDKIKKIEASSSSVFYVTENGRLFTKGIQIFNNERKLQEISQHLFDNEFIRCVKDHVTGTLVLTNLNSVFFFSPEGQKTKFTCFKSTVKQICAGKTGSFILTEGKYCLTINYINYKNNY